jgi:hypothetical protein
MAKIWPACARYPHGLWTSLRTSVWRVAAYVAAAGFHSTLAKKSPPVLLDEHIGFGIVDAIGVAPVPCRTIATIHTACGQTCGHHVETALHPLPDKHCKRVGEKMTAEKV